ncbi:MAG: phytoene desaturase family protein, partial [Spirochaetia bacterium]
MHKTKKILIIGAGMGGMAAGIYGRLHGYDTEIFEMHSLPGGQCTAYKRKGFIFDVCIHHLFGCAPGSKLYDLWSDLGVMPRKIILPEECTSVRSPDGTIFRDFYDLDKLQNHMLDLSNEDKKIIAGYIKDSKRVSKRDFTNAMIFDGIPGLFRNLGALLPLIPKFTMTLEKYGKKFRSPFLRRAFGKLVYSLSDVPLIVHLARKGKGLTGDIGWPAGGSLSFAGSMENRFRDLGGEIHYRSKVTEIL